MSKLVIENKTKNLSDQDACSLVMRVINGGRVSNGGKQYCYATVFTFELPDKKYVVHCSINKKSDRFIVEDA
jgi:hypothetical protein